MTIKANTCSYDTYGEQLSHEGETNQPFQYNGRDGVQTDANGLYQMRARYYNPEIKRFVNRDVLSGRIDDGLTMNRYAYVNGNPVSYIDPFGLSADGATWWQTGLSFAADATPFVGTLKGIQEVFTGVDMITGQQMSVTDRVATGVGTAASWIPFGKVVGKQLAKEGIEGGAWLVGKLDFKLKKNATQYAESGGRNIPPEQFFKEEAIAEELYEKFRKMGTRDVNSIAENTGFSIARIQRIKDHVFNKSHIKDHGVGKFDPDYELAQAWQRLIDGKQVDSDIQLLHHEIFESKFEGIFRTNYRTAHDKTMESGRPWNWEKNYEE